ncbi:hypothetical protein C8F04DRAFT_1061993 [Mycena alexandri]|uniref:Condensation domain-containing protein n=1 Tax=Mycena alexandri TaxID=1745969 RepID=A0AAD6XG74_9AGAR|nr:hypothetical protein C8F04DRAFT_1061993 [Mycena alexandri]
MIMSGWMQMGRGDHHVYTRPLGLNELGFYYDSHINGTADTLMHITIQVSADGASYVDPENVARAWCALKSQFPLLGGTIQLYNSLPHFVVTEERLKSITSNEIFFSSIPSIEEAQNAAEVELHGKRNLSDDLLARLVVLSRADDPSTYHVLINIAHLITDGVGNTSLLGQFLNLLSSPGDHSVANLEARLSLAVAAESLVPAAKMSVARQRWRRAAGQIICQLQDAKRTGGHTLPRFYGPVATQLPARSGFLRAALFSPAESLPIMQNLRKHGISVGNALPVLAQVAMARVLSRRYVRGEIDAEEWEFRKKQPYHTAGPIDLRPLLDKSWYKNGGQTNVSVNIGYFYFTLGFMSLSSANLAPGDSAPEFSKLMSPERFWLRCNRMKHLASVYLNHPLFFEIGEARLAGKITNRRQVAAKWEKDPQSYVRPGEVEEHNVSAIDQVKFGSVMSHGWSSYGDMSKNLPREYPVNTRAPMLRLEGLQQLLHCRTGELYLGSGVSAGQLYLIMFFDTNVFPQETVQEWVEETKQAMMWYLGETQALTSKL